MLVSEMIINEYCWVHFISEMEKLYQYALYLAFQTESLIFLVLFFLKNESHERQDIVLQNPYFFINSYTYQYCDLMERFGSIIISERNMQMSIPNSLTRDSRQKLRLINMHLVPIFSGNERQMDMSEQQRTCRV